MAWRRYQVRPAAEHQIAQLSQEMDRVLGDADEFSVDDQVNGRTIRISRDTSFADAAVYEMQQFEPPVDGLMLATDILIKRYTDTDKTIADNCFNLDLISGLILAAVDTVPELPVIAFEGVASITSSYASATSIKNIDAVLETVPDVRELTSQQAKVARRALKALTGR